MTVSPETRRVVLLCVVTAVLVIILKYFWG